MFEKSEIIAAINKRAFYESFFGELTSGNGWIRKPVNCPFHSDARASLSINLESGRWNCFSQCGGGSIVDFVMIMQGVDFKAALAYLADYSGIGNAPNPEMQARIRRERRERRIAAGKRQREHDFLEIIIALRNLPWTTRAYWGLEKWPIKYKIRWKAGLPKWEWIEEDFELWPDHRDFFLGEWETKLIDELEFFVRGLEGLPRTLPTIHDARRKRADLDCEDLVERLDGYDIKF